MSGSVKRIILFLPLEQGEERACLILVSKVVIVQPQRHGDTKIIIYSFNGIFNKRYVLDLQFSGIDSSLFHKVL